MLLRPNIDGKLLAKQLTSSKFSINLDPTNEKLGSNHAWKSVQGHGRAANEYNLVNDRSAKYFVRHIAPVKYEVKWLWYKI